MCVCGGGARGAEQSSTPEALLGVQARGWPEGTGRLEEPSAGRQLNKRWEGSVSVEGQERREAPAPRSEDKQMLGPGRRDGEERGGDKRQRGSLLLHNLAELHLLEQTCSLCQEIHRDASITARTASNTLEPA